MTTELLDAALLDARSRAVTALGALLVETPGECSPELAAALRALQDANEDEPFAGTAGALLLAKDAVLALAEALAMDPATVLRGVAGSEREAAPDRSPGPQARG